MIFKSTWLKIYNLSAWELKITQVFHLNSSSMVSILASTTIELKKKSQDPQVHGENMSKGSVQVIYFFFVPNLFRLLTGVAKDVKNLQDNFDDLE